MTKRPLLILSLIFLVASLPLTGFTLNNDNFRGYWLLIDGWVDMDHLDGVSWLANPVFIAAFILLLTGKRIAIRIALYLSVCSILLAASFLLIREVSYFFSKETVFRNAGYWLWLFAMITLFLSAIGVNRKFHSADNSVVLTE